MSSPSRVRPLLARVLGRSRTIQIGILLLIVLGEIAVVASILATSLRVGLNVFWGASLGAVGLFLAWSLVRRRLQFGLKELLAGTFLVAAVMSWLGPEMLRLQRQGRAVARITYLGGNVSFAPVGPPRSWFRRFIGDQAAGTVIHVYFMRGATVADADLALIANLTDLEALSLSRCRVDEGGLAHLTTLRRLNRLILRESSVGDGAAHLAGLESLQYLDLSETRVTDFTLERLCRSASLEELHLTNTLVTGSGFATLQDSTRLRILTLNHAPLSDTEIPILNRRGSVDSLDLSDTPLSDAGLAKLAGGLSASLRSLKLARTAVTDKSALQLSKFSRLDVLDLAGTTISDAALPDLGRLNVLRYLGLDRTQVTDAGLAHIGHMGRPRSLQRAKSGAADSGLKSLGGMASLERLDLSGTQVTAAGIAHLANLPSLGDLNLNDSRVTDEHLENLLLVRTLCRCQLNGTLVGDAGLRALAAAREPARKRRLPPRELLMTLHGSKATPRGRQSLRDAKPNWHIQP